MDLRREIITALQLLGLLYLLFRSFTWNLPDNYDMCPPRKHLKSVPESSLKKATDLNLKEVSLNENKHSIILQSIKTVNHVGNKAGRMATVGNSMLPPFNAWKEVELTKQERNDEVRGKTPGKSKLSRRKLNYASSKCGAKILASNTEAKYRTAILNEKVDEYMLNPCKARSWFIIELCDTIEATQVELANYELYSSSPKTFSTFWSNVYPTQTWRHLGTFEAKDRRAMQTFDLDVHNLGKFIKVTVFNHHGKEHFCPLSVFRIVGFSMVYEYEEIETENEKNMSSTNESDSTLKRKMKKPSNSTNRNSNSLGREDGTTQKKWYSRSDSHRVKMCQIEQKYCSSTKHGKPRRRSLHQPSCLFLKSLLLNTQDTHTCNNVCTPNNYFYVKPKLRDKRNESSSSFPLRSGGMNNSTGNETDIKNGNIFSDFLHSDSFKRSDLLQFLFSLNRNRTLNRVSKVKKNNPKRKGNRAKELKSSKYKVGETNDNYQFKFLQQTQSKKHSKQNIPVSESQNQCDCTNDKKSAKEVQKNHEFCDSSKTEYFEPENSAESAALIQKESVLVKLTSRIRTSEMNLNLINRYLQQLSESYRLQMEDMQNMFNRTMKAIRIASAKALKIDKLQQDAIEKLQHQMETLSFKVKYLAKGHEDSLKRVLELHGCFLILEIIIMSTIFSIFVNKFKQSKRFIQ